MPTIYELIRAKHQSVTLGFEDQALLRHSYYRRNMIKMVGVWDTVGSIGLPLGKFRGWTQSLGFGMGANGQRADR